MSKVSVYFKIPQETADKWPGSIVFTNGPRRPHIPICEIDLDAEQQSLTDIRVAVAHMASEIKPFVVAFQLGDSDSTGIQWLSAVGNQLSFNTEVIQTALSRLGFSGLMSPPGEATPVVWGFSVPPADMRCTISEIGVAQI